MKTLKKQLRRVGVAGSFQNQMMGNNATEPVVGEGATILMYSDRHAYEVISVSEDGLSCTIREMSTKFVGQGYGDERYEYSSNENNHTMNLEWNEKKGTWGEVTYRVEVIKALRKRLEKTYGWLNIFEGIESEFGIKKDDMYEKIYEDDWYNPMKEIKGVTKKYKNFRKVSIIFGMMSEYRDPSF